MGISEQEIAHSAAMPRPEDQSADALRAWVVVRLSDIGYQLAASATMLDGPARDRTDSAIRDLDLLIHELRGRSPDL